MKDLIKASTEVLMELNEGVNKSAEFVPNPRGEGEILKVPVGNKDAFISTGGDALNVELFVDKMQVLGLKPRKTGAVFLEYEMDTRGLTSKHIKALVNGFEMKKTSTRKTSKFVLDHYQGSRGMRPTSVFVLSKGSKIVGMYVSNKGDSTELNILDTAYGI